MDAGHTGEIVQTVSIYKWFGQYGHDDDVMLIENESGKPRSSFLMMMDGFCNIPWFPEFSRAQE